VQQEAPASSQEIKMTKAQIIALRKYELAIYRYGK